MDRYDIAAAVWLAFCAIAFLTMAATRIVTYYTPEKKQETGGQFTVLEEVKVLVNRGGEDSGVLTLKRGTVIKVIFEQEESTPVVIAGE